MGFSLGISSYQTTNEAANTSTVYCTLTLYTGGNSYSGYSTSWGMSIGGAGFGGSGPSALFNPNSWSTTQSYTFTHDANGYRGNVDCYVSFNGSGGYSPPYMEAGPSTQGAIDYDRKPAAPTTVTPVANADKTITVTSNVVSSPAGTPTYYVQWASSADGSTWGSWSSDITISGNSRSYTFAVGSLTFGLYYKFRMKASNTDGTSGYTESNNPGSVFLAASGKRYTGSAWVNSTSGMIYNGTAWVPITSAKRYNGTAWVQLT